MMLLCTEHAPASRGLVLRAHAGVGCDPGGGGGHGAGGARG